jgi:dCMP deaminase
MATAADLSQRMDRYLKKFQVAVKFCNDLSQLSTCKRLQVAAVIVDHRFTKVLSIGYNGPPSHSEYECTGEPGNCGCVHAEANALIKLTNRSPHMFMITTHTPCVHCAGLIINAGIDAVFSVKPYRAGNTMNFIMIGDESDEVLKRWCVNYEIGRAAGLA